MVGYAVATSLPTWCNIDTSLELISTIHEATSLPALNIHPNPVHDVLYIENEMYEPFLS